MIETARQRFNASFSPEKYQNLLQEIEKEFPNQLDFRIAETPVFIDRDLKIKLLSAFNDVVDSIKKPDFFSKTQRAIPQGYQVANSTAHPECLAVDFAITQDENGNLNPQLVELQGFPSLFAYQTYLAGKYRKHFDIDRSFSEFFNRMNSMAYTKEMQNIVLGNAQPENTVLVDIFPEQQKTRIDFALSEKIWGIKTVGIHDIIQEGKDLYYINNGQKIGIHRIYNRVIIDEWKQKFPNTPFPIQWDQELNVTWVSHPNWYYQVSKFAIPLLKSKYIPETKYLSDILQIPSDLENYVLKPLFSFAGKGVLIDVTPSDLESISDPENYILQRKISYAPVVKDVANEGIKCEIRLLAIWPQNEDRPKLMTNVTRLSKGKMIGVDFNKDLDWVGGSVALFETN